MKIFRLLLIVLSVCGLVGVRIVEDHLFYDPFIHYFKGLNKSTVFPEVEMLRLSINHFFRFILNLIFSCALIHLIFKRKLWTLQALILMVLVYFLVFPIYLYCVHTKFEIGTLFTFYVRRFVIQPILVLILIPIFFYRKHLEKSNL